MKSPVPNLAPPGAGLPWVELQVALLIFHSQRMLASEATSAKRIRNERNAIQLLLTDIPEETLTALSLIRRIPGLEDSSRNWSALMTVSHLEIVNRTVGSAMQSLLNGIIPSTPASTAAVKPTRNVGKECIAGFSDSCELLLSLATEAPSLDTPIRYPHPWFGNLSAAGWFFMAGFHMALHKRQIEIILQQQRAA